MEKIKRLFGRLWRAALPWLAMVITLTLFGVALYFGDPMWWALFCFAFVITVHGLVYTRLSRRCIHVQLARESAVVRRCDPCSIRVVVTYRLPLLWNGIRLRYSNPSAEGIVQSECMIPPPQGAFRSRQQTVLLPINTRYKGGYEIGLTGALHADLLGLFRARLSIDHPSSRSSVTVYPKAVEIHDNQLMLHLRQGAAPSHSIFEAGLSGENRGYVVGDPLKMVNWKLTARMGRLYVKKQEDDSSAGINVYIAAIPTTRDSIELEQLAADQAASVAMQALSLHPRIAFYAYPSANPVSFGGMGQFDATLGYLASTSFQSADYAPDLENSIIRENLLQINVAIVPAHASKEVFSLLLSMRKDSILFVNGYLDPEVRAELERMALTQGVALVFTAPAPVYELTKEAVIC